MLSFEQLDETWIRFAAFAIVFVLVACLELLRPKRHLRARKDRRWLTNLTIVALDSLIVRGMAMLSVPLAALAAAYYAERQGIGLLNVLDAPLWLNVFLTVILLDFAIWLQHVIFHKIPLLWRLHQVHHADPDIDVSTALRFHPIEIAASMIWKIVCVLTLGASAAGVLLFEVILNACAMFSHANLDLPARLDRIVRKLIVTPDMHRVHHSVLRREHDSNYGFNLSIWDRLFGTYRDQPEAGHQGMTIGLPPYQSEAPTRLSWSLLLPFQRLPPQ